MHTKKISVSFFAAVTTIFVLTAGIAWAAPLLAGPIYMPLVMKYPTYTPTATLNPTPTSTPTRTPTLTSTAPASPIANPGFELGQIGWVFSSNQGDPIISSPFAHSGNFSAALGNGRDLRQASISQQFTVPFNNYNLVYWQYIQSVELCGPRYDYVTIYVNGIASQSFNVCEGLSSLDWSQAIINLVNYRGQNIVFRMEYSGDASNGSYFYVDDFSFVP